MNSLSTKIYFLMLLFFSTLSLSAQVDHVGNFTASGDLKSESGSIFLGNNHFLENLNVSTLNYTSGHDNQAQFLLSTAENETLGSLWGHNGAFGIRDKDGDWFLNTFADLHASLMVDDNLAMRWYADGKVKIGDVDINTQNDYKLYVEDGILSESLRVAVNGEEDWADYVFADNFELMPLSNVKEFIAENDHLPNVPSAETMVNTGLDVLQSDAILLRKIEEAYLYILNQNDNMIVQQKQLLKQQNQIDELIKQIAELKIISNED